MRISTIDLVRLERKGSEAQRLWALVLLLAIRDHATRVWYDPALGDNQLGYEIGGAEYAMVPPPESLQEVLPGVLADLVCRPSPWRALVSVLGRARRRSVQGSFRLQVGDHAITAAAVVEPACTRVVVQMSAADPAAQAAGTALQAILADYNLSAAAADRCPRHGDA